MTYKDEITLQMNKLSCNDKVRFIGYNTRYGSQAYGTLVGVPVDRIIETPVAENLMVGMAIGMALEGYLSIVWFERHDFILNALDAIVNHLDKIEYLSKGDYKPKVIIRACIGGTKPIYPEVQHVQNYSLALVLMCKNINVLSCNTKEDVKYWWSQAVNADKSSIIIEWRDKYEE